VLEALLAILQRSFLYSAEKHSKFFTSSETNGSIMEQVSTADIRYAASYTTQYNCNRYRLPSRAQKCTRLNINGPGQGLDQGPHTVAALD